jgi:hypothetical protein
MSDTAPATPNQTAARAAAPAPAVEPPPTPLAITHAAMNTAYNKGEAIPLAPTATWLTRYRDAWWVVYERGWLRITDPATAADLDQAATRLAATSEAHSVFPPPA